MDAKEAFKAGMVNRVVPGNHLLSVAGEMAKQIAGRHPDAVKLAKEAVIRGLDLPLPLGLDMEKKLADRMFAVKNRQA
jgi:enoyl-CoA hydratase/carnithine racemase